MRHIKRIKIIVLLIILSCCFLSIGYASIANINLSLTGTAQLDKQTGIVISSVVLDNYSGVDLDLSEINTYYKTMLDSKTVLGNDPTSYITYHVTVTNLSNKEKRFTGVIFDDEFYDNEDITYELIGLDVGDTVAAGESKTFTVKFKYLDQENPPTNTVLNSVIKFNFKDKYDYGFETTCEFNGVGNDIVGDCANGEHIDFINTGYQLFNRDNYLTDFEINFEIGDVDPSRFRNGKVDTVLSCIDENEPFPGMVFRIENGKWYFQAGNGIDTATKISFNKDDVQSFRIVRENGIVSYSINGGELVQAADFNTISRTFGIPLTIGTTFNTDGTPWTARYFQGTLSNFYLSVPDYQQPGQITYDDIDEMIEEFIGQPLQVVFDSPEAHIFDGNNENIINTGFSLLDEDNYQKDFVVTLMLDEIDFNDQVNQATLVNIKNEALNNVWPGVALRIQSKKLELTYRDGASANKTVNIDNGAERINIIKRDMKLYYQVDYGEIVMLGDFSNFNKVFDVPVTFGSNIDANGNYARKFKGTLSDMSIKITN